MRILRRTENGAPFFLRCIRFLNLRKICNRNKSSGFPSSGVLYYLTGAAKKVPRIGYQIIAGIHYNKHKGRLITGGQIIGISEKRRNKMEQYGIKK